MKPNATIATATASDSDTSSSRPGVTSPRPYSVWWSVGLFLFAIWFVGRNVSGPGLSWDEPAYRHSQVTLQEWLRELRDAPNREARRELFSADAIDHYWEYNRFGHNFHPPMAGYGNLLTYSLLGDWLGDIAARRMASVLEFAFAAAMLTHFLGRRYGWPVGVFAGLTLLTTPRVLGDAHVIGTDMPLLFFWVATSFAFHRSLGLEGESDRSARLWQFATALLLACLFLVKFTGAMVMAPLLLWFFLSFAIRVDRKAWSSWTQGSLVLFLPLVPLAITLLFGERAQRPSAQGWTIAIARWGLENPLVVGATFFWPPIWIFLRRRFGTLRRDLPMGMEALWMIVAWTPLFAIALNPTWYHETVPALARYFNLNLDRQGQLPSIGIFYLGQRYFYTLPWHNAYVWMLVTLPLGTLLLGLYGLAVSLRRIRTDLMPVYFLAQALTLPVLRMFGTPCHDGVRLFLPTFVFWAAFAAWGAWGLVERAHAPRTRRLLYGGLLLLGPVWAGWDAVRVHPYELSYYNLGLKRMSTWFDPTYWYDAVTPQVLADLNEKLPPKTSLQFPDPLINPETFQALQQLGELRGDLDLEGRDREAFPWFMLLTHPAKGTARTRLMYAMEPWYESGHEGVRLFSIVDGRRAAIALAIHLLTVEEEDSRRLGSLRVRSGWESPSSLETFTRLAKLLETYGPSAPEHLGMEPPSVQREVQRLFQPQTLPIVTGITRHYPDAFRRAVEILKTRPADVRRVIESPAYLPPEAFGGYFSGD